MVTKTSTNGKSEPITRDNGQTAFLLYDFDIEGTIVKYEHMRILREEIAKRLEKGGSIDIVGMTDRTGSEALNGSLSTARAMGALTYLKGILKQKGIKDIKVGTFKGVGTTVATQQLQQPNTLNERYRSVYVVVWNKPDPPPAPKPEEVKLPDGKKLLDSIQPDLSPLGDSLTDTFGKVMDVGSAAAEGLGPLAGLLFPAKAIVGVAAAEWIALGGSALGILSAIISSPQAWAAQDAAANVNGHIVGLYQAYEDMAAAFKDSALDTKPLGQWPAIPKPVVHPLSSPPLLVMDKVHQKAREEGCNDAWNAVMAMETKPMDFTSGGKTIKVTGKMFLRALYVSSGGNVKDAILKSVNVQLKKTGHHEYPTN